MRNDLLEYSSVKGYIRSHIVSDMGVTALEALAPCEAWAEAESKWGLLRTMMRMVETQRVPLAPLPDIRPLLALPDGVVLEAQDLLKVAGALKDMARLRQGLETDDAALADLAAGIIPLDDLARAIETNILPTGEVSDQKNPLLRQLRTRMRTVRATVLERLEEILARVNPVVMESIITIRNNRYVIPMRHDYNTYLPGITHDYSGSRHSVYVEPMEVVEDNNALNELRAEIREEEYKVLLELTSQIVHASPTIQAGLEAYAALDLLHACAQWALACRATIPALGEEFELKQARHPVLIERLGKGCIPLDIRIPRGKDGLVISGPNAGGKTVALKTLGLLVAMAKSGLAIPVAEGSVIPPVARIWVEMDTAQDIAHDLSTFTAHAAALKDIHAHVGPGDLVLLDEPGTGTDHDHGGAIAIACIDAFRQRGAYVVVTSHSDLVKLYGLSQPGIENAAAAFDEKGLRPLYALQYGVIGSSRAFEILRSIDFPPALLDTAGEIVSRHGNTALLHAMQDMGQAHALREQAEREAQEAADLKARAQAALQDIERQKAENALRYKRLLERLEALLRRPAPEALKTVTELPEAVELARIAQESSASEALRIATGTQVRIKGSEAIGVVQAIEQDMVAILCGTKRITVGLEQIEAVAHVPARERSARYVKAFAPVVMPIVVVGMRVDEALAILEKALDRALLSGQNTLEIVHGSGTGTLKKAIRSHLKGLSLVQGFSDGTTEQGGGNVTVVRLQGEDR